jgi:hypothetical protein
VTIAPVGSVCTEVDPSVGCLGIKTGSTGAQNRLAVDDFIATHDPGAYWTNGGGGSEWQTGVINSTMAQSSRIAPIAVFDVPQYLGAGYNGSNGIVRVVNMVGFFIEGTCNDSFYKEPYIDCPAGGSAQAAVVGRLVNYQATQVGTGGPRGAFGQVLVLVR